MGEWLPQVVEITTVKKHPDADALSIVTTSIGDYPVIVKLDEYQVGDLCVYIPIDTIVPSTEQFYFLCPKKYIDMEGPDGNITKVAVGPRYEVGSVPEKYRIIKAKKIRGCYSAGMLTPLPAMTSILPIPEALTYQWNVGDSVAEVMNLRKWEEEEEENLPNIKRPRGTNAEKAPQGWTIPHYDIDGLRKYLSCLKPDEEICLTEKLNGSNAAFVHDGNRLWCKSRNWFKRMDPDDMWWDVAIRYDLKTKLAQYPMMVLFGEIVGQVKGFKYDAKIENGKLLNTVHFFDVWDLKNQRYLDYDDRVSIIKAAGLSHVPELYRGVWNDKDEMYSYAEGMSTLNPKCIREGFVVNTLKERYEPRLNARCQFKLISQQYTLNK